jgi:hypothetical protein
MPMKPWNAQTTKEITSQPKLEELSLAKQVEALNAVLTINRSYWSTVGAQKPMVCQFRLTGEGAADWFVDVGPQGATAQLGLHPTPNATWTSDLATYFGALRGELDADKIKLDGDANAMREFFIAVGSTKL